MNFAYPFAALVGQEAMKSALVLNAIDSTLGGVLIRGQKGTGKTTAVRALAELLPSIEVVEGCPFQSSPFDPLSMSEECRSRYESGEKLPVVRRPMKLVELPLNTTEDRLVGSLHVEEALLSGRRRFDPGILASVHRGILYIDEVNLLEDHLVDMLLDVASCGINRVEREGISCTHPSRFILVGTMNPEEGTLRPQFLDRFGLCVQVKGVRDPKMRQEIVRRRIAFERGPLDFIAQWTQEQDSLSRQIVYAQTRLDQVRISDESLALASQISADLEVQGHRADITIVKAARALAAFLEKEEIGPDQIAQAAHFALPHRVQEGPLDNPESIERKIDDALRRACPGLPITSEKECEESKEEEATTRFTPQNVESAEGEYLFEIGRASCRERG